MTAWLMVLELVLPFVLLRLRPDRLGLALRSPALLAPLALFFPWAVVPGELGVALVGPAFFGEWLTKYPNFGPVNAEVLLGILCLVGASTFPVLLAAYELGGGRSGWLRLCLAIAVVASYLPVFVALDVALVLVGTMGQRTAWGGGPMPEALLGPVVRGLAFVSAIAGSWVSFASQKAR